MGFLNLAQIKVALVPYIWVLIKDDAWRNTIFIYLRSKLFQILQLIQSMMLTIFNA